MTDLPTALREWRGAYPARVAAEALGVSARTYEGWEQGRASSAVEALLRIIMRHPVETYDQQKTRSKAG